MTETDPMPNPVAVDSERAEGNSKKGRGYGNRNLNRRRSEEPNGGSETSWMSRFCDAVTM